MQKSLIRYSLVIPCYNESDNLSILIDRCKILLDNREDIEVLLVNNGSTDNTHVVLKDLLRGVDQLNLRIVYICKNQGYGFERV